MDAQGPDHSGTLANRYTILLIATQITGLCHTRLFLLPVSIVFINENRNGDDTPEIWASLCVTKIIRTLYFSFTLDTYETISGNRYKNKCRENDCFTFRNNEKDSFLAMTNHRFP
jgi:hypothetical protein